MFGSFTACSAVAFGGESLAAGAELVGLVGRLLHLGFLEDGLVDRVHLRRQLDLKLVLGLGEAGILDPDRITRFWPVVLIVFGLSILQRGGSNVITGLIMTLVGAWLLLNTLHFMRLEPWQFIWPLILVVIGGRIILRRGGRHNPPPGSAPPGNGFGNGFAPQQPQPQPASLRLPHTGQSSAEPRPRSSRPSSHRSPEPLPTAPESYQPAPRPS